MNHVTESDDLRASVDSWVNQQGYPLEYATAHAFETAGYEVLIGSHLPPDAQPERERKPEAREVDVRAWRGPEGLLQDDSLLTVVICECKYSRKKPWLLLYSDMTVGFTSSWAALPMTRWLAEASGPWLESMADSFSTNAHLAGDRSFAHNLVQAHSNEQGGRDAAYKALMKIARLARVFAEDPFPTSQPQVTHAVVVPCLVVDAPLFEGRYEPKNGRIRVTQTLFGQILWTGAGRRTVVDVVTRTNLEMYVRGLDSSFNEIVEVLNHHRIERGRSTPI